MGEINKLDFLSKIDIIIIEKVLTKIKSDETLKINLRKKKFQSSWYYCSDLLYNYSFHNVDIYGDW